jgi:protein-S-isoprenylcysteine O-methyltransferase Ste14
LRIGNALASAALVILACAAFGAVPVHRQSLQHTYGPATWQVSGVGFLVTAAGIYILLLTIFFLAEASPGVSKSLRVCQLSGRLLTSPARTLRDGLSKEDGLALRVVLLKGFFGPLMGMSLMQFCLNAWANGLGMLQVGIPDSGVRDLFDHFGFWFLMQVILLVDVFIFTVGYLIESPRLKNEIRSVDPTWLGWAAALACYPPINTLSGKLLSSPVTDFPQFENTTLHLSLNVTLLLLMAIYASASVALGLKASNLTHRGIVARGPYAVVRHPAYVTKNLAWWIGSIPIVSAGFDMSFMDGIKAVLAMAGWSAVYVLRALTEEDHLRSVDGDYAVYAAKVKFRFVPGIV